MPPGPRGFVNGGRATTSRFLQDSNLGRLSAIALGILSGLLLGWVVMETADSMLTTGVHLHVGHKQAAGSSQAVAAQTPGGNSLRNKVGALVAAGQHTTQQVAATVGLAGSTLPSVTGSAKPAGTTIHSLMTSSGSAYQNFQGRIMYGTYKLVQKMPGGEVLTGFTRILHRVHEDECMDEIPTFHAKPLHPECDAWCDFPVADRPNAVGQWISAVLKNPSMLKGAWVALLECDYVWMKPLPSPGNAYTSDVPGWQFHFGYIMAQHPDCAHIIRRLYDGGDPADIPNSGPAPALLRFTELATVTPLWEKITATIEEDKEAVKVLGWIREMYAWDIALAKAKVKMLTEDPPHSPLLAQPPADHVMGNASMAHYTWGAVYNDTTHTVWTWDKRTYTDQHFALKPEPIPMPPTDWAEGKYHLQEFFGKAPVPKDLHDTLTDMIGQMNKAIATLPDLTSKFNALKAAQGQAR